MEYGLEADPGRLTVSHPLFATLDAARSAATAPCMERPGVAPVRILRRSVGQEWRVVGSSVPPVAAGEKLAVEHTCAGSICAAPIVIDRVTAMGGITGDWRLGGERCDGTRIEVAVWHSGAEVEA